MTIMDWMVKVHRELLDVGGYTAIVVTVVAVLAAHNHIRIREIIIRFNGKAKK